MSHQRSLDQQRAAAAWKRSREAAGNTDYFRIARGAPADVQVNGLGQTLAFWNAKKGAHALLLRDLSAWVMPRLGRGSGDLLAWVVAEAGTGDYRRATAEAIAYLAWLKRFAEAELAERGEAVEA